MSFSQTTAAAITDYAQKMLGQYYSPEEIAEGLERVDIVDIRLPDDSDFLLDNIRDEIEILEDAD
jgi:hypothetical protein